jgi:hypothetical protein
MTLAAGKSNIRRTQTARNSGKAYRILHAAFLLGSFFDPENGRDMFVPNVV